MCQYPEIERLKQYLEDFDVNVEKIDKDDNTSDAFWVRFSINENAWDIFIDDEYQHFNKPKSLINLYLTLVALEVYKESNDYLVWCNVNFLKVSDMKWLNYYNSLEVIHNEVEKILGKIDSQVSSFDYTLQTGLGKTLINH